MAAVTEELRAKAEICQSHEKCREKTILILEEMGLPNGLLPLKDMEEFGIVRETGMFWIKQKKSISHKFEKIGETVSFATEVTGVMEKQKIKNLKGVKCREFLIWLGVTEMYIDKPESGEITFKTSTGISDSFPISALQIEDDERKQVITEKTVEEAAKEV